jgi:hypothetical protein
VVGLAAGGVDPSIDWIRAGVELGRYPADSTFRFWSLGALSVSELPGGTADWERLESLGNLSGTWRKLFR